MFWPQKKKIKGLLLDRDVWNKLGNIPNTAALGGLSRLFWPHGALTENGLSPPKPDDLAASLRSYMCLKSPNSSFTFNGSSLSFPWK